MPPVTAATTLIFVEPVPTLIPLRRYRSSISLKVAEFLTRANYGMRIGNFELDFSDGEVRYKSSLDFEGVGLEPIMIRNAIYPAVQTMDRYFPGLIAVVAGAKSAAEAVQVVEQEDPPQNSRN